jgi:hypothetical protein
MRPSRLVIVGLAGLVALHIFMLAGHGREHAPWAGTPVVDDHADAASCCPTPMATNERRTGADMTVACLAVVAGLLLLRPRQRHQLATSRPDERTTTRYPARGHPGRLRPRSLEELCISLT